MTPESPKPIENISLGGLILAGGKSRRMGTDKAALLLSGQAFIERIVQRLTGRLNPLLVVARTEQLESLGKLLSGETRNSSVELISDQHPDRGPLEALATGLEYLAARDVEFAAVTTCDAPEVKPELFHWLTQRMEAGAEIVMPTDGKHRYGLTAVYRTSCAVKFRELLEQGVRRVIDLPLYLPTTSVTLEDCRCVDPLLQSFRNANTPDEYEALRQELEAR